MSNTQPIIGIQLDLKGMQFRPSYLPTFLKDLADQKINTIVVEYEDTFPFEGLDIAYDKTTVWKPSQVRKLNELASELGIQIIPLQQCLGHLEYVLSWNKYRHLALDQKYPSTINPENPEARELVFNMLDQVLKAHPQSQYIHLGMDEAHAIVTHYGQEKVVDVYLDQLERLLDRVEAAGKKAIVWPGMLTDGLVKVNPRLKSFKDRVVMFSCNYVVFGPTVALGNLSGNHVAKAWLDEPANPEAPAIGPKTTFVEDQPKAIQTLLKPYQKGRFFESGFLTDMWSSLGFEVIGGSTFRRSADYSVFPVYHQKTQNMEVWSKKALDKRFLGHIATSWSRGNTYNPPNYCIDAAWPLIGDLARSMGATPKPFFEGIPQKTVDRIINSLGRCRQDWSIELQLADEMEALLPKLKSHQYEWQGIALLARVHNAHRRADFARLEVTHFAPNHRPVDSEWQRRLDDQQAVLKLLTGLKRQVKSHFGKRWYGKAFDEWVGQLFDVSFQNVRALQAECQAKLKLARQVYRSRR